MSTEREDLSSKLACANLRIVNFNKIYRKRGLFQSKKIDKKVAFFILLCYNHLECRIVGSLHLDFAKKLYNS